MTHAVLVLACVLQTVENKDATDPRCQGPFIQEIVASIRSVSYMGVPPGIIAAVIYHESKYDPRTKGTHGEMGLMQPKPHGAISGRYLKLTKSQIEDVGPNIWIGTEYLATFIHRCKRISGGLTMYNRPRNGCRPSSYSAGVLKDLRTGRSVRLDQLPASLPHREDWTKLSWGASWDPPPPNDETSPLPEDPRKTIDHTSSTEEAPLPHMSPNYEHRPSDTYRSSMQAETEQKLEQVVHEPSTATGGGQ